MIGVFFKQPFFLSLLVKRESKKLERERRSLLLVGDCLVKRESKKLERERYK